MSADDASDTAPVPLEDIAELKAKQLEIDGRLQGVEDTQGEILRQLRVNTEITAGISDFLTAGKVGTKLLVWTGSISGALAGILALVWSFLDRR